MNNDPNQNDPTTPQGGMPTGDVGQTPMSTPDPAPVEPVIPVVPTPVADETIETPAPSVDTPVPGATSETPEPEGVPQEGGNPGGQDAV